MGNERTYRDEMSAVRLERLRTRVGVRLAFVAARSGALRGEGLADYFGGELFVEECGVHGKEGVVAAVFYGAFAVAVDKDGALLGLGVGDAANVDEGFDDVVEGVDIVVVEDEVAAGVFEYVGFVVRKG